MKQVQIDRELEHIMVMMKVNAGKYEKEDKIGKWPEQTKMKVCILLLRCEKLEKKIKGIIKLK